MFSFSIYIKICVCDCICMCLYLYIYIYVFVAVVMIMCSTILVGISMSTVYFEIDVFPLMAMTCHDLRFHVRHMIICLLLSSQWFIWRNSLYFKARSEYLFC